jgi:hypothetical protein
MTSPDLIEHLFKGLGGHDFGLNIAALQLFGEGAQGGHLHDHGLEMSLRTSDACHLHNEDWARK